MLWMNRDRSTQLLFKKSALSVVLNAEMTAQDLSLLSLVFPSFLPHPLAIYVSPCFCLF